MLRRLQIRDFVIVDDLELEFGSGFGALTGETGAGKSILVDALALALGERADAAVVRQGCEKTDISAEFDLAAGAPADRWLRDNDLEAEARTCLLRRVVDAGGRSRAYINGAAVTLTQLRQLGEMLADLHGQHAHHALLRSDAQRDLLDAHAGLSEPARRVAGLYRDWSRLRAARESAEADAAASAGEAQMLDWQLGELEQLQFDAAQWQATNQEHGRLAHAASLTEGVAQAMMLLDEGEASVASRLAQVGARLAPLAGIDGDLAEPRALLESARNETAEALRALRHYHDRLELDPDRLAVIEARIAAVTDVARKHRVAPEDLPALYERLAARREELRVLADPQALAAREQAARAAYHEAAAELGRRRAQAARALSADVTDAMQDLAMAGGRFEIALEPLAEAGASGLEAVEFRVAANPNQPLRPLAKVASGGELSRIGLAIQVITSRSGQAPTLVFDEVDVGIGGAVAEIVGRMLKSVAAQRQVLCVTHLPQVAAQADWQWSVAKEGDGAAVVSRVRALDRDARIEEIARMLGGVRITPTTRRHAAEMLGAGS